MVGPSDMTLRWRAAVLAILVAACTGGLALAQTSVDLQLVLAVDASGSVNQYLFDLQKQGYAEAFRNPRVLKAIRSGIAGAIAVTVVQWTGPDLQMQVIDWTLVKDERSANAFAAAMEDTPRQLFSGGTSISGAIDHAVTLLLNSARDYPGARRCRARRHHHQRPADPRARARSRPLLLRQRDRRSGRLHGHGANLRDV